MKPQVLIIPLSRPKPKRPEIPDAHTDYLTRNCERRLTLAEATKETARMPAVESKPITGWRRLVIKWRLRMQYRAECRAAAV